VPAQGLAGRGVHDSGGVGARGEASAALKDLRFAASMEAGLAVAIVARSAMIYRRQGDAMTTRLTLKAIG
jgi:hypothetical protein